MQAFSAACTGAAIAAAGTYQMYHAVWKSRDHIAEASSVYRVQVDPTGRQPPPKRLHDEVTRGFISHWNEGVHVLHAFLANQLKALQQR